MVERRESLERLAKEIIGVEIEPDELEIIARRLRALKVALDDLTPLVIQVSEPLTMAALEDD
jgi:hypothetical protein